MQQFQAFLSCMFYMWWQPVTILRLVWSRSARMQTLYLSYLTTGHSPWPGFPRVKPSVSVLKAVVTVGESDGDAAGTFRSLRYALRDASILTPHRCNFHCRASSHKHHCTTDSVVCEMYGCQSPHSTGRGLSNGIQWQVWPLNQHKWGHYRVKDRTLKSEFCEIFVNINSIPTDINLS